MSENNGSKADSYQKGDRCFAKLKGFPAWPAQVQERLPGKEEKYFVHFYGSHDSAQVKVQNIFSYDKKNISKYGKPAKPSATFKQAMEEMEANLELYDAASEQMEPAVEEPDEGDLQIDETPPPVLKREGKIPAPKSAPKEPAPKPARRLSKSSKRDSFSAASGVPSPVAETPPPVPAPQPEIVSRSGRKIKPKRFADDEIGSPVTALAKAALQSQSSMDDGKGEPSPSAPKRSKKQKGNGVASPAPALTPEQPAPKISEPKSRAKGARGTPKAQIDPTLTPISAPPRTKLTPVVPAAPVPKAPAPELSPEIDSDSNSAAPTLTKAEEIIPTEDESREDIEDKENSAANWLNRAQEEDAGSEGSSESKTESKQFDTEVEADESSGESLKVPLAVKKDTEVEIIYNHDKPKEFPSQKARIEWDVATAKNVLKIRETLESAEPTAVELFNLLAAAVEQKESELIDIMEKALSQKRRAKLHKLRIEGEVIEIIGDVITCLSAGAADCDRAIELLERLKNHDLTSLILKKHPEIVETVRKLRFYEGNAEEWELSTEQAEEFDEKTAMIRDRACKIYESFKVTFGCTPDKSFEKDYAEELQRFKDYCSTLSAKEFLNMTDEPTSEPSGAGDIAGVDEMYESQEYDEGMNNNGDSISEGDIDDSTMEEQEGVGEDEETPGDLESDQGEAA